MVTFAPDRSFSVFDRFENVSPPAAVSANSGPIRAAEAGTSAETGEADVQVSLSGDLPVLTLEGSCLNLRSNRPGVPSAVSGALVTGCVQVVRCVPMFGCSIRDRKSVV